MNAIKKLRDVAAGIPLEHSSGGFLAAAGCESATVRQVAAQMLFCKRANRLPQLIQNGSWEQLEQCWKIVRGSVVEEIFYSIRLPKDWLLKPSSHSLWSDLLDSRDALRAHIFYNALGPDCRANLILACRYLIKGESMLAPGAAMHRLRHRIVDMATGKTIFETDWKYNYENALSLPLEFLNQYYPEHRNPFAYWPD